MVKKWVYRLLTKDDISDAIIGRQVFVYWPDYSAWYRAVVKRCNIKSMIATLYYPDTEESEDRAELAELIAGIDGKIAYRESRPEDHVLADNEIEAPLATKAAEDDIYYVFSDSDDSIIDDGERVDHSDVSYSSGEDEVPLAKRKRSTYSDNDLDDEDYEDDGDLRRRDSTGSGYQKSAKMLKQTPRKSAPASGIKGERHSQLKPKSFKPREDPEIRLKVRDVFYKALQLAVTELKDVVDIPDATALRIATEIEGTMVKMFDGTNAEYKNKARSLSFNLKDQHNPELRAHVIRGDIAPDTLANMSAAELASKELTEYRKKKEEEALKMSVIDAEAAAKFSTAAALDARDKLAMPTALVADKLLTAKEEEQGDPGSPLPLRMESTVLRSGSIQEKAEPDDEYSPGVYKKEEEEEDEKLPAAKIDWTNVRAQAFSEAAQKPKDAPQIDLKGLEMLKPLERKPSDTLQPLPVASSGKKNELVWLFQTPDPSSVANPTNWSAQVIVPTIGDFPMTSDILAGTMSLHQLAGHADLTLRGRVALGKLESFLKDLKLSKSRAASVVLLKPAATITPEQLEVLKDVVEQYGSKQRSGVAQPAPGVEVYTLPASELASQVIEAARHAAPGLVSSALGAGNVLPPDCFLGVTVYKRSFETQLAPAPAPAMVPAADNAGVSLPAGLDLSAISALAQAFGVP